MLQSLLARRGWLKDGQDGEYGPLTAQAVYRAKYRLGYRRPDQKAAGLLMDLLEKQRKPTRAMRARAARRERLRKKTPLRVKALKRAARDIGMKESPPNSNWSPISRRWGLQGPWCAMAASIWYIDAGSKSFAQGWRYAYCPYIVNDARAGVNNLTITNHPKPGDLTLYDWDRDGIADHVGLFENWISGGEGTELIAVEANTAVGNDSNGGQVMRRHRKRTQVIAFVHVGR